MASKAPQGNASNGYSRQELEALSQQTGTPVEVLWTMGRRDVRQLSEKAASAQLEARNTAAAEAARRDAETKAAGDKAAQEKLAAERPLRERMPWVDSATTAGSFATLLMPILARAFGSNQRYIRAWEKAIAEAEKTQGAARAGTGSVAEGKVAGDVVSNFEKNYVAPGKGITDTAGRVAKDAAIVGGTGITASEIPAIPALLDNWQFKGSPDSRAYKEAQPQMGWGPAIQRAGESAPLFGGLAATTLKLGTIANRIPPIARSSGVTNQMKPGWADDTAQLAKNYGAAAGQQADLSEQLTRELLAHKQLQSWQGAAPARAPALPAPTLPQPSQRLPSPQAQQALEAPSGGAPTLPPGRPGGIGQEAQQSGQPTGLHRQPGIDATGISLPPGPSNSSNGPILAAPQPISTVNSTGTTSSNGKSRVGPWEQTWSDPARAVIEEQIAAGGGIGRGGISALQLQERIGSKLGPGVKVPSNAEVGKRLKDLRDTVGPQPTMEELKSQWASDPRRQLFGGAAIGGGIGATTLAGSDEASADVPSAAKLKILEALMGAGYRP